MPTCPFCSKMYSQQASVCPHCLKTQPDTVGATRRAAGAAGDAMHGKWRLLFLVLLLAGVSAWGWDRYKKLPANAYSPDTPLAPAPEPAPQVVQTTIAQPIDVPVADSASVRIEGGKFAAFPFSGVSRTECRVTGHVRVLTGGDRRVNVSVVDRDGLSELEAGRPPRTWWESGPTADAALDFKVDGRTSYTLVVANAGARAKTVRLKAIRAACSD
jgi:hypothetical protein